MLPSHNRGTAGVWNGTNIKLFRVQDSGAQGPTLRDPRGAVDYLGNSLVQRIGSFNIRGGAAGGGAPKPSATSGTTAGQRGSTTSTGTTGAGGNGVRDV